MPFKSIEDSQEYQRNYQKKWRKKNKDKVNRYNRRWWNREYAENEKFRLKQSLRQVLLKEKKKEAIINYYGGKCVECGISDKDVLTIDHINSESPKIFRGNVRITGSEFYSYLIKNDLPSGFQVLCFNCNYKKYLRDLRSRFSKLEKGQHNGRFSR